MMVGALTAPQVLSRRPVTGYRWLALGLFAIIFTALFLTDSRGSMLGLAAGLGIVALVRYRQLVWWMLAAAVLALFLPITQDFIDRLIAGFTGADLETQMRLGEYGDALRLIGRYPVLGVGFSAPPDIDLYIGFASTYLTITANAGLIGLLAFLIAVGSVFRYGYQKRAAIAQNQALVDIWLGLAAGIIGALVGGIFDHFYFNIDFQATALTFWLFVGLLLVTTRLAAPSDEREEFGILHVPRVNRPLNPTPSSTDLPSQERKPVAEPVPGSD
jgi:O-antigen ligase